ncbi:MAG: hypothetical protein WA196_15995, partial [Pseudolabrys sp.]
SRPAEHRCIASSAGATWLVAVSALKFAKAMQQFALHGVNFGCGLLDQKLRAWCSKRHPK